MNVLSFSHENVPLFTRAITSSFNLQHIMNSLPFSHKSIPQFTKASDRGAITSSFNLQNIMNSLSFSHKSIPLFTSASDRGAITSSLLAWSFVAAAINEESESVHKSSAARSSSSITLICGRHTKARNAYYIVTSHAGAWSRAFAFLPRLWHETTSSLWSLSNISLWRAYKTWLEMQQVSLPFPISATRSCHDIRLRMIQY